MQFQDFRKISPLNAGNHIYNSILIGKQEFYSVAIGIIPTKRHEQGPLCAGGGLRAAGCVWEA
jgi:hypothetical protein